jgi:hypothetical protein
MATAREIAAAIRDDYQSGCTEPAERLDDVPDELLIIEELEMTIAYEREEWLPRTRW